jgi:hypothetical protein
VKINDARLLFLIFIDIMQIIIMLGGIKMPDADKTILIEVLKGTQSFSGG